MKVDPKDLLAQEDIALLAKVGPSAVSNWKVRHADFPAPVTWVSRGTMPLYWRDEVVEYFIRHGVGGFTYVKPADEPTEPVA